MEKPVRVPSLNQLRRQTRTLKKEIRKNEKLMIEVRKIKDLQERLFNSEMEKLAALGLSPKH